MENMKLSSLILTILSIGFLMIVHESGHFFAARRFGMRVKKFSIGFGPTLWKNKMRGSDTMFQLGIIPFLAYVQIEGMNPFEEDGGKSEAEDESKKTWASEVPKSELEPSLSSPSGRYSDASLYARIVTISAGSLANYACSSLLLLLIYLTVGQSHSSFRITMTPLAGESAAADAGVQAGDRLIAVDNQSIDDVESILSALKTKAGMKVDLEVERGGESLHLYPIPKLVHGEGKIQVLLNAEVLKRERIPMKVKDAFAAAVRQPAWFVYMNLKGIVDMLTLRSPPDVAGPVKMAQEVSGQFSRSFSDGFEMVAYVSAALAFFNLLPFPGLDGGRFSFLIYEAVARRKPNPKSEAIVHGIGILMLLALMFIVTSKEVFQLISPKK